MSTLDDEQVNVCISVLLLHCMWCVHQGILDEIHSLNTREIAILSEFEWKFRKLPMIGS